jgi:hypothetical protein
MTLGLQAQDLDVPREWIIRLVAVQVHGEAALGSRPAQRRNGAMPLLHGPLEMRDAADHIDAAVERALKVGGGCSRAEIAVLGKCDELQIEIRRDTALDLQQGIDRQQPVIAYVDMAADSEQAHRHGPVAIGERSLDHRLLRQQRFQLGPERDAL